MVAVGVGVAVSSARRSDPVWPAWAVLAIGLCVAASGVWIYGVHRWRDLRTVAVWRRREALLPSAIPLLAVVLGLALSTIAVGPGSTVRGAVLCLIAAVGGSPAGAVIFGIRAMANRISQPEAGVGDLRVAWREAGELRLLRRLLQRLGAALGTLVSLATLALGVNRPTPDTPAATVIVFGAFGTAVLALYYAPASVALRRAAERLTQTVFSGTVPGSAREFVDLLEQRAKLDLALGADRTMLGDLQVAVPVLGPLLAAAAVFLTR
jgi:hypothetical protein